MQSTPQGTVTRFPPPGRHTSLARTRELLPGRPAPPIHFARNRTIPTSHRPRLSCHDQQVVRGAMGHRWGVSRSFPQRPEKA